MRGLWGDKGGKESGKGKRREKGINVSFQRTILFIKIHAIVLYNDLCKDIEQDRTQKFMEVHFQYSLYSTVKNLI